MRVLKSVNSFNGHCFNNSESRKIRFDYEKNNTNNSKTLHELLLLYQSWYNLGKKEELVWSKLNFYPIKRGGADLR